MVTALITAILSYLGTTSDYLMILLLVFTRYQQTKQRQNVVIGAYLGNLVLVILSLLVAMLLKQVPDEWLLGLLGLIPIYLGIKGYFWPKDESNEVAERLSGMSAGRIILNVIVLTVATCGADNLALYIPYFANLNMLYLPLILGAFIVILTLIIGLAWWGSRLNFIGQLFKRYGEKIQLVIYVGLGVYVMFEAGTIQSLLHLL
ncbi:cadmium resistance transporter [Weissella diestrammenae]|uniref:Cadmium resistance transporter n=1 Tax=Weissella diestrammenae TaxID=1162633 RepID=A0A7G9T7F3_9LACO|nr:cadmium resistance transporter [Weissella diestrammenae]MCM0582084.1 cadmium resistance transporter [Weissella diestrammenae]QNN76028.1 cadmium resistance transporter [Weissella diestrammenae]